MSTVKAHPAVTLLASYTAPHSWRWLALLYVLWSGMSPAAEALPPPDSQRISQPIFSFSTTQLKNGLVWLRDITVKTLTPVHGSDPQDEQPRDSEVKLPFAVGRELFKPMGEEAYRIMVEQLLDQQMGLQVRDNVRLQWDISQYRTVDDQREVGLKLGLHFDFR